MSQRTQYNKGLRKKLRRHSGQIVRESWERTMGERWYDRAKLASRLVPELWVFLILGASWGALLTWALVQGYLVMR